MRARRPSLLRIPRARSLLLAGVLAIVISVAALAAHAYTDLLVLRRARQRGRVLDHAAVEAPRLRRGRRRHRRHRAGQPPRGRAAQPRHGRRRCRAPSAGSRIRSSRSPPGSPAAQWHAPGTWSLLALWSGRTDFGVTDPLFHRDAGFYVFSLPLYQHVVAWLLASLAMAAAASLAAHAVAGGIRRDGRLVVSRGARTHLLLLAALVLLVVSWRYRLDRYSLALPHGGLTGAGFTDAHVRAPARAALAVARGDRRRHRRRRRRRSAEAAPHRHHARARGPGRRCPRADRAPARALRGPAPEARQGTAVRLRLDRRHAPGLRARSHRRPRLPGRPACVGRRPRAEPRDGRQRPALGRGRAAPGDRRAPGARALLQLPEHDAGPLPGRRRHPLDDRRGAPARPHARSAAMPVAGPTPRFAYTHGFGVAAVRSTRGRSRPPAVRPDRLRGRREPARPARATHLLRRAARPPARRTSWSTAAAPRSTSPRPGSEAPDYHYDGPGGIGLSGLAAALGLRAALRRPQPAAVARPSPAARGSSCTATPASGCARWRRSCAGTGTRRPSSPAAASSSSSTATRRAATTRTRSRSSSAARRVNYARAAVHAVVDAFTGSVRIYAADADDPILRAWRAVYPGLFRPAAEMPRRAARAPALPASAVRRPGRGVRDLPRRRRRPRSGTARTPGSARASWPGRSRRSARSTSPTARRRATRDAAPSTVCSHGSPANGASASCSRRRSRRAGARTSSPTSPARSTRAAGRGSRCSACRATA